MTIVGIDDTDSREDGMCTTYVAARIAERLRAFGEVSRLVLVRLNPAVEHKTRGNAALAVHTTVSPDRAFEIASEEIEAGAIQADPRTNPGLVVTGNGVIARDVASKGDDGSIARIPEAVSEFARSAVVDFRTIDDAISIAEAAGYRVASWGDGRGRIGALAAVGARDAFDEWTYERIAYREPERWGTQRQVDSASVRAVADDAYPAVWDTVDREADELVCVPRTPGPVLFGIRGDSRRAVERVAARIDAEPVLTAATFETNQGTDAHLQDGTLGSLRDGRAYCVDGIVDDEPETRRGGHVFVPITDQAGERRTPCVAFEPTKRFRDHVRALRPGDGVTVCGEVSRGTIKLEKFALRDRTTHERVIPTCPDCGRTMESAGRDQGYRCRDCSKTTVEREQVALDRSIQPGWYEVPPRARRHIAKPLVRGGFDAPVHPER